MRVLIAEDDIIIRRLLEVTVSRWGFEAVLCVDGEEAWRQLEQPDAPELLILDWMMPGIEGVEICRRLRASPTNRLTYVILLTARGRTEDIVAGLHAGADDYVTKPFEREELHARLQVGVRMIELQRAVAANSRELAVARTEAMARERFDAAVAAMSDGIVVMGPDWRIISANRAAGLLMYHSVDLKLEPSADSGAASSAGPVSSSGDSEGTRDILQGHTLQEVLRGFELSVSLEELQSRAERETALEITRSDTRPPLYLDGRLTRLFDAEGQPAGAVLTVRDVTEARHARFLQANFFRLVSHKLRTPLTVLSAYMQVLERATPERRIQKLPQMIDSLISQTRQLDEVIRRLLEFRALTVEELAAEAGGAWVEESTRTAMARVQARYPDKAVELSFDLSGEQSMVDMSPGHLEVVLDKLLDNAVKFGDKSPVVVKVTAGRSGQRIRLTVSDNGPGIPHEYFDRVLDGFVQVEDRLTGQVDGLGVGLALARRVLETYGGSISLQSRLGVGTSVHCLLPVPPDATPLG